MRLDWSGEGIRPATSRSSRERHDVQIPEEGVKHLERPKIGRLQKGVIVVEGRMVERLHLGTAEGTGRLPSKFARWRPPAAKGDPRERLFRPQQGDSFAGSFAFDPKRGFLCDSL